jgi:hypothetical protein
MERTRGPLLTSFLKHGRTNKRPRTAVRMIKILVVDNESEICTFLEALFSKEGCEGVTADTGYDALSPGN